MLAYTSWLVQSVTCVNWLASLLDCLAISLDAFPLTSIAWLACLFGQCGCLLAECDRYGTLCLNKWSLIGCFDDLLGYLVPCYVCLVCIGLRDWCAYLFA